MIIPGHDLAYLRRNSGTVAPGLNPHLPTFGSARGREFFGRLVRGGPRIYLIERPAFAYLRQIRDLDDSSGSGGSAAQICSTQAFPDSTPFGVRQDKLAKNRR
jgi:hypothetical protein